MSQACLIPKSMQQSVLQTWHTVEHKLAHLHYVNSSSYARISMRLLATAQAQHQMQR